LTFANSKARDLGWIVEVSSGAPSSVYDLGSCGLRVTANHCCRWYLALGAGWPLIHESESGDHGNPYSLDKLAPALFFESGASFSPGSRFPQASVHYREGQLSEVDGPRCQVLFRRASLFCVWFSPRVHDASSGF
jgi:hypothetical protein